MVWRSPVEQLRPHAALAPAHRRRHPHRCARPSTSRPPCAPALAEAQAWCKTLATTHYENFHVATAFLPKRLRPHFHSIYAFCRASDDLGDEVADTATATRLLGQWRAMLHQLLCTRPRPRAIRSTSPCSPPSRSAASTLSPSTTSFHAFEEDQVLTHHTSLLSLERYSRCSANPVGRLVLMVSGYRSPEHVRALRRHLHRAPTGELLPGHRRRC